MPVRTRPARALAVTAAFLLLGAAACGDDDGDAATADEPTTAAPGDDDAGAEESGGGGDASAAGTIEVAESELGDILTSGGMTLYVFTPDDGGPSTCYDDCAANWPPLLADGEVAAGDGVDPSLLGTAPRDDGGEQVTVDGWPVYFYAADAAPGDTNGQGVGDVWWVIAPDGTPIS